jgi:hypothetical protein
MLSMTQHDRYVVAAILFSASTCLLLACGFLRLLNEPPGDEDEGDEPAWDEDREAADLVSELAPKPCRARLKTAFAVSLLQLLCGTVGYLYGWRFAG